MAQPAKDESLLQTNIDADLFERYTRQRERWGMSNRQMLTRILEQALPEWEAAAGPPAAASK